MNKNENEIDENEWMRVLSGWRKDTEGKEWDPYMEHTLLSLLEYIEETKMDLKNTSVQELLNIIFSYIQKEITQAAEDRKMERQERKEGIEQSLKWICEIVEECSMDQEKDSIQELLDVLFDIKHHMEG